MVSIDGPVIERRRAVLAYDRLEVIGRFVAVLPRLPDEVVGAFVDDVAVWEAQYTPDLPK